MKVINPVFSIITNLEVQQFLQESKKTRKTHGMRNLATITYEILQHLDEVVLKTQTVENITNYLKDLIPFKLQVSEMIMMVNDPPKTALHIQLMVDDMTSPISDADVDSLIELTKKHFAPKPKHKRSKKSKSKAASAKSVAKKEETSTAETATISKLPVKEVVFIEPCAAVKETEILYAVEESGSSKLTTINENSDLEFVDENGMPITQYSTAEETVTTAFAAESNAAVVLATEKANAAAVLAAKEATAATALAAMEADIDPARVIMEAEIYTDCGTLLINK